MINLIMINLSYFLLFSPSNAKVQSDIILDIYNNATAYESGIGCMVNCEIDNVGLMDSITQCIHHSINIVDQQWLTDLVANRFEIEIYPLVADSPVFNFSDSKRFIDIEPSGSYYIEVGVYEPEKGKAYGFDYNGFSFYTDSFVRNLFINARIPLYYTRNPTDPDIDEYGYFGDWRFIIDKGKIVEALLMTPSKCYDIISGVEITVDDLISRIPILYRSGNIQSSIVPRIRKLHNVQNYID